MPDRVKYFLLGLLFLVVAGVIAYDRWNSRDGLPESEVAARDRADSGNFFVGPGNESAGNGHAAADEHRLTIDPPPNDDGPDPHPADNRTKSGSRPDPVKPKPLPAPRKRVHIVKSGEALEKISRMYYPGEVYKGIQLIVKSNRLRSANVISEGQKLVIPAMDARATRRPSVIDSKSSTSSRSVPKPKRGVPSTYVVKSSDGDLYRICRRFYGRNGEGARVARIMEANSLWSVNVKAGTRLKLPKK